MEVNVIRLVVKAIGTPPGSASERVLASLTSDQFDPNHLELQINAALAAALAAVGGVALASLRAWQLQIAVSLSADGTPLRPAIHLGQQTLCQLVDASAEFDFDPYV
jgi:hypothetical protein